ncbi:hypothetical protein Tco_0683537 [Tanacetum coccineum]|uniref:Uncharacterized protein n=1 Tax=Tanacetum coccineum TaxID=301880 RepID=A0ABQ4XUE8_9ASTR
MSETSVANDTPGLVPQRQKASDYDNPDPAPELQNVSPLVDTTVTSQQELDLFFGPLYDEFFNDGTSHVNKSSSPTNNSAPQDTHPSTNIHPTSEPSTPTNVHVEENNDNQAEFTNPFCTSVQENAESSSCNIVFGCSWFKFGFGHLCGLLEVVRDYGFDCDLGHHSRLFEFSPLSVCDNMRLRDPTLDVTNADEIIRFHNWLIAMGDCHTPPRQKREV